MFSRAGGTHGSGPRGRAHWNGGRHPWTLLIEGPHGAITSLQQRWTSVADSGSCAVGLIEEVFDPLAVVTERMPIGRPMNGPAHGGAPEMVESGKSRLLTPPADVSALAVTVNPLHGDPEYARRLGVAARMRTLHLPVVETHVHCVHAAYGRLTLAGWMS